MGTMERMKLMEKMERAEIAKTHLRQTELELWPVQVTRGLAVLVSS